MVETKTIRQTGNNGWYCLCIVGDGTRTWWNFEWIIGKAVGKCRRRSQQSDWTSVLGSLRGIMCNNFCILEQFKNDHNVQNNWFQFRNRVNLCYPPSLTKEFVATIMFRYSSSRVGLIFTCKFLFPVWMVRVQMAVTSWSLGAMELQWNLHSKSASLFHFMSTSFLAFWYGKLNQFYPRVLLNLLFEVTK